MTMSASTSGTAAPGRAGLIPRETILVGIDGSAGSIAALHWAIAESRRHDRPLTVIHVVASPTSAGFPQTTVAGVDDALMAAAESSLGNVLEDVLGDARPAGVRREVRQGNPARVLIEAADDASLLVVGARGHGSFLLGSVSDRCVHHATCPVVVVRS
jgi:nucleotide-binding universal stress UspA family protein